ncbi:hypothetical protein D9615_006277 [Tricholomella constricta]|uniref:DUF6533 domain-containing protein n=1 Tax=Tricholomella constricta TaxID=117010 RepID=A0A8H5HB70_9AGAR|nr:hypothetical protein D9615_006277 [Tricholomella constricta]
MQITSSKATCLRPICQSGSLEDDEAPYSSTQEFSRSAYRDGASVARSSLQQQQLLHSRPQTSHTSSDGQQSGIDSPPCLTPHINQALLYFDYALTFGMEVEYIWLQKFRFSTVLYIWCRYGLVANVVYLLTIANKITLSIEAND